MLFNTSLLAQSIAINEVLASNSAGITDEDGDNEDWIELYNYGSTSINLGGFGLSDDQELPFKWVFPSVSIGPGKYILVWASGKNRATTLSSLHTNFNISAQGEGLLLTNAQGIRVDELVTTPVPADYSYGRYPDGTGEWHYYTETTPGGPNSQNTTFLPPDPPAFSISSGFYTEDIALVLSHPNTDATIIFTLDGSEPAVENLTGVSYFYKNQYPQDPGQEPGPLLSNTYSSATYSDTLFITDRSTEPDKLSNISSTWHYSPDYFPSEPIRKATVVRAVAIVNGKSSTIATHTYFVSPTSAFSSSLPIASISLNEDGLFDYNDGIYVAGKDFDNWRNSNPSAITNGHSPANYRRRGTATEKRASFQYFVDGNEVIKQNIGLRLQGSFSRHVQNKTFRLYARSEYDSNNSFNYQFFGPSNSTSFKRLILRNSGNDAGNYWIGGAYQWTYSPAVYFRDAFIHRMVSHLRFDTQDYMPVITYVNGEYWGLLNLRERYDSHYLERVYGVKESELDYLTGSGSVKIGNNSHYLMMRNFIENNNLALADNYNYVKTLMDTDNFMDYQISQIYARNTDWPGNNTDYFRKRTSEYRPDAPYGQDGRWRWMMFDTDHGFGWSGGTSYTHNTLQGASNNASSTSTVILTKLLLNPSFRYDFIIRYADLLNTAFLPDRLISMINELADRIADEIPLHRERWNTLINWLEHVELMREFAEKRPAYARNHIRSRFSLGTDYTAVLNVSDNEHGYIRLNTIDITEKTPGVSENPYPWSGIYFRHIPINITAVPKPGYQFSHWSGTSNSDEASITLTPTGNISLQANFIPIQQGDYDLIYFWLIDDNLANNTPLQTISSTFSTSGNHATLSFLSSMGEGYPFHSGDINWRKGSMERRNAPTPVNYHPVANYNLAYGDFEMRSIQIKQPFLTNGFENTLIIDFSTANFHNIIVSFAAMDEGAANRMVIDYFDTDTGKWVNTGMVVTDTELTGSYKQFDVNLSHVPQANNSPGFKLRIRFSGTDLTKDEGNRVSFNNFSVKGTQFLSSNPKGAASDLSNITLVYPNPFWDHITVHIDLILTGSQYDFYNLNGNLIQSGILTQPTTVLNLAHITSGVYLLKIGNEKKVQFIKVVKQ